MTFLRIEKELPKDISPETDLLFCFKSDDFVPQCNFAENVGMDFKIDINRDYTLQQFEICKLPLGFKIAFPSGFELQIRPRSGLSLEGIVLVNSPATIDPSYRGEVNVIVSNISNAPVVLKPKQRICQGVITSYFYFKQKPEHSYRICFIVNETIFDNWDSIFPSNRGRSGFGSTGVL